ncbi:DUF1311 domain-containing protein [Caldibacillus hisashii]|nr:DUF1311 domain-containing protein [Caldifermentibacillus hisashii]
MSACSNSSDKATSTNNQSNAESTDASFQSNDSPADSTVESDNSSNNHSDESSNLQGEVSKGQTNNTTKIEGRRTEFIEKLDSIQKELDTLPAKKDSDKGVTNAMKDYYGISYEKYDEALNEIYVLLKKELSPETMKDLKAEQINWIEQKEDKANEERQKYEGGTNENVAYYTSLYESTKDRCYELVNNYMTD